MAKQSKASAAKSVKKQPTAKKAVAKKVAAAKPAAKKTAAKQPAAKKPAAKKTATPKLAAKKTAAKQPTAKKPAAKKTAAKKTAAKKTATRKVAAPTQLIALTINAAPVITSPAAGPVTANADLTVTITTNRDDLPYVITLTDITGSRPSVPYTNNIPAPGTSPFTHTIPANKLPAGRTFKISVEVDPSAGSTPPNGTAEVTITT